MTRRPPRPPARAPWRGGDPGTRGRLKPLRVGSGSAIAAKAERLRAGGTCSYAGLGDCHGPLVAIPRDAGDPTPTDPASYALACNDHAVERAYRHRHGVADDLTAPLPEEDPVTEPADPKADALEVVHERSDIVASLEARLAAARADRRRAYLAARTAGATQREIAEAAGTSGPAVNDQLKQAEREAGEA